MIFRETAGTVATKRCGNHHLIPSNPVQTAEERYQVVLALTLTEVSVSGLTALGRIGIGHRIDTCTLAQVLVVEVLPLVTCHDIEVLTGFLPVVTVLCVAVELEVIFHLLRETVPTGVVAGGSQHIVDIHLLTERIVGTEVSMENKIFKVMNLIGSLEVTNELSGIGGVGLMFEHSHRVSRGAETVHPIRIIVRTGCIG